MPRELEMGASSHFPKHTTVHDKWENAHSLGMKDEEEEQGRKTIRIWANGYKYQLKQRIMKHLPM